MTLPSHTFTSTQHPVQDLSHRASCMGLSCPLLDKLHWCSHMLMQRSASPVVCPIFLLHPQVGKSGNNNRIASMEVKAFLSAPSDLLSVFPSFWPLCPSYASPNDFLDLLCTFPLSTSVSCLKCALNSTWETSVQNNLATFCFCLSSIDADVVIGSNSHTLRHTSVHILE